MIAVVIPLTSLNVCRRPCAGAAPDLPAALTIGIMGALGVGRCSRPTWRDGGLDPTRARLAPRATCLAADVRHCGRARLLFLLGCLFIAESPRWLQRRGRPQEALVALSRSCRWAKPRPNSPPSRRWRRRSAWAGAPCSSGATSSPSCSTAPSSRSTSDRHQLAAAVRGG